MKISFSTLSCPDWSWNKVLEEAARLGYDGIELRGIDGEMFLPKAKPFLPENLEGSMKQLLEKGLEITDLGSSCQFHDPRKLADNINEGKAYIDLAQSIGVPYVRIFGNEIPDPGKKEETIERIAGAISELCSYCEGKNVSVLLETHGDFGDCVNMRALLEKVKSPYLGILWDIEHTYVHSGEDVTDFLDMAGKLIKHTHIKDVIKSGNSFKSCITGKGEIPVKQLIDSMKQIGFDGYLSLEWEKKWHPELEEPEVVLPDYIEYIKSLL